MTTSGTTHFVGDDCQPAHSPRINENVHIEHCECWLDLDRLKAQLAEATETITNLHESLALADADVETATEQLRRQGEVVEAARDVNATYHGFDSDKRWVDWARLNKALQGLDAAVPAASSGEPG